MASAQLCTFCVDDLLFGVEVTQVQEVLRYQPMTRIPLAPDRIRGLINLRGQIVTAIDLRSCLGFAPRAQSEEPMNVVIRGVESSISLLVDSIGDVIEVPEEAFESAPSTMKPAQRNLIHGVYKLTGRLLLVLAPDRVLTSAQAQAASRPGERVA